MNQQASPIEAALSGLYEAVKRQVLTEVEQSLKGTAWESAPAKRLPPAKANGVLRKGEKRDPKLLAATVQHLYDDIAAHPGERIEQVAARLGLPTKDLTLPVKKLLAGKKIRSKGVKRATRYFPR